VQASFSDMDVLAFAGGGNRCWWQAGVVAHLMDKGWKLPETLVGTSAGAAVAASCLTTGPEAALAACVRLYADNQHLFHWRGLAKLKLHFAHQQTYPEWITSIVNTDSFATLQQAKQKLWVAISRPARFLGLHGSVAAGTLAYIVDKKISHSIHPRLPKFLGLRQEFLRLEQSVSVQAAQDFLNAAAGAPPFTHPVALGGQWAFDGGYVDNAPIPKQSTEQQTKTLVLLTRHYPNRPSLFQLHGRTYWQPSQAVPVSTWDCTAKSTVCAAFDLGVQDARALLGNSPMARDEGR
jgi:predicted patatin/cPLA2 family phospholipase